MPAAHLGDSVVGPPAYVPPPDLPKYEETRTEVAGASAGEGAGSSTGEAREAERATGVEGEGTGTRLGPVPEDTENVPSERRG